MVSPKSASGQNVPNISAAELEIKRRGRRRLIGACTMGLLAIVFLPMIFDSEPKKQKSGSQEIAIQMPPKEGLAPLPAPVVASPIAAPVGVPPSPPSAAAANSSASAPVTASAAPATPPPQAAVVTAMPFVPKAIPAPPVAVKEPPKKLAPEPKTAAPIAAAKQGFVVQIGAFKDADNAQQIVTRMKESKLPVFTDKIATAGGSVTRVRVGPFTSKEKADSALVQVKLAGSDGKIVPLP